MYGESNCGNGAIAYKCNVVADVKTEFETHKNERSLEDILKEDLEDAGWDVENIEVSLNGGIRWRDGFTCGVAWACAMLRENGAMTADELWQASNMTDEDLDACNPTDVELVTTFVK